MAFFVQTGPITKNQAYARETDRPNMDETTSKSIYLELRARHGSNLRQDLIDVLLVKNHETSSLITDTSSGRDVMDLSFITSGDEPAFPPESSIDEIILAFLGMADIGSLCMTTDLIKPDACRLHFQHDA